MNENKTIMKSFNNLVYVITFLFLICFVSCNPSHKSLDDIVREHILQSKNPRFFENNIIDSIRYDTIGTGGWGYNLATIMIDHPELFSDKGLFDDLLLVLNDIDTTDHRMRLIANVYGHNQRECFLYYIGVIGDSLTNIEEKRTFSDAPIEALLNICTPAEKRILDIANVIELSDRHISSLVNNKILTILSNWWAVHKFSITQPIFNAKGNTKDTTLQLQFTGISINERIDSVLLKHTKYSVTKDFLIGNYGCYHLNNSIKTISGIHELVTYLYTIDERIVLIKAVCYDDIFGELYDMYNTKYGRDVNVYSFDETFCKLETGSSNHIWSFSNNAIVLVNNNARYDTYYPDVTYRQPKILRSNYVFKNVIIIYCDKQMYRRLVQKEEQRRSSIEREQSVLDSLNQLEKQRNDSIQKAKKDERIRINTLQV